MSTQHNFGPFLFRGGLFSFLLPKYKRGVCSYAGLIRNSCILTERVTMPGQDLPLETIFKNGEYTTISLHQETVYVLERKKDGLYGLYCSKRQRFILSVSYHQMHFLGKFCFVRKEMVHGAFNPQTEQWFISLQFHRLVFTTRTVRVRKEKKNKEMPIVEAYYHRNPIPVVFDFEKGKGCTRK